MTLVLVRPTAPGGVADFVEILATELEQSVHATIVARRLEVSAGETVPALRAGDIAIIQYSGYGYAKRGAPLWILEHLKPWRNGNIRLGTFFHEIYALGPPWRSSFWLSPLQRYVARRLVEVSDFWMTNRDASAKWLERFGGAKPHAVLPVFSTVGESKGAAGERQPKLVVFGSEELRARTYRQALPDLARWAELQGVEIHDIGPIIADSEIGAQLSCANVIIHGRLRAQEVHELLSTATFGVVTYPVGFAAKSTVFAAYCAHGLCPVLISHSCAGADGLVAGTHYVSGIPTGRVTARDVIEVASNAWTWYQAHNVREHARVIQCLATGGISANAS